MTSSSLNSENKSPSDIDSIVKKYLYESCLPQEVNPLTYWKSHATHESEFECLSKVALTYLCIPASSALSKEFLVSLEKFFDRNGVALKIELLKNSCSSNAT